MKPSGRRTPRDQSATSTPEKQEAPAKKGKAQPKAKPKATKIDRSKRLQAVHNDDHDPSQPLPCGKWEAFSIGVSKGLTQAQAYREASGGKPRSGDRQAASALITFRDVSSRVRWLQEQTATKAVLTMQERREFLARVVRCQLKDIDFDEDGDLIQEYVEEYTEQGRKLRIKLPGKRECIMDDAKLSGDLEERDQTITHVHVSLDELKKRREQEAEWTASKLVDKSS